MAQQKKATVKTVSYGEKPERILVGVEIFKCAKCGGDIHLPEKYQNYGICLGKNCGTTVKFRVHYEVE